MPNTAFMSGVPLARPGCSGSRLLFIVPNPRHTCAVFRGAMIALAIESVMALTTIGSFLAWGVLRR
jgi:hypothetical protein